MEDIITRINFLIEKATKQKQRKKRLLLQEALVKLEKAKDLDY